MILNPFSTPLNGGNGPEFITSGYLTANQTINLQLTPNKNILINAFPNINNLNSYVTSNALYCKPSYDTQRIFIVKPNASIVIIVSVEFLYDGSLSLKAIDYDSYYTIYYAS